MKQTGQRGRAIEKAESVLFSERAAGREPMLLAWWGIEVARRYLRGEVTAEQVKGVRFEVIEAEVELDLKRNALERRALRYVEQALRPSPERK